MTTFCVVRVPSENIDLKLPYTAADILLDGADIPFFALLQECDADDVRMGMQELDPGGVYPMHFHESPEVYVVLEGKAAWTVGDEHVNAQDGTSVYSPPNVPHRVANTGDVPLRWLYFWWAPGGDRVAFREAGP